MKKNYFLTIIRVTFSSVFFFCFSLFAMAQCFPTPDIALTFDDTDTTYHSQVTDISGKNNHAYWYNWWFGDSTMYAKYAPDGGKIGGSWYISGYHACCEEMASSSMDLIFFAGSQKDGDVPELQGVSPLFHNGFTSVTVAFWFKSDRNYTETTRTPCPPLANGMHEQELLFSMGKRNGFAIANDKGFYNIKIGKAEGELPVVYKEIRLCYNGVNRAEYTWQHIAVTFDGADGGKLTAYIDGELAVSGYADPNPVSSGWTGLLTDNSSAEIGAQNNAGLFGDPGDGFWGSVGGDPAPQYCVYAEDVGKYRTGWPANCYYDEFVFYKDVVLTKEQIQCLVTNGIEECLNPDAIYKIPEANAQIYPNPAPGYIYVKFRNQSQDYLKIYNVVGAMAFEKLIKNGDRIDISSLQKGIYIVKIGSDYTTKLIVK